MQKWQICIFLCLKKANSHEKINKKGNFKNLEKKEGI